MTSPPVASQGHASAISEVLVLLAHEGDTSESVGSPSRRSYVEGVSRSASVADIVTVWLKWATDVEAVVTIAAIYIDRACANTGVQLCSANVNGYLVAALVLATKWCDDKANRVSIQRKYSSVFGLPLASLNCLERDLLTDLSWALHVDQATYNAYTVGFSQLLRKRPVSSPHYKRSRSVS